MSYPNTVEFQCTDCNNGKVEVESDDVDDGDEYINELCVVCGGYREFKRT